jgi:hypothetical protein
MKHITAHSVFDGVMDEDHVFCKQEDYAAWLQDLAVVAAETGAPVVVYAMLHDHPPGECECIQYVTDLNPLITFNFKE